MKVEFKNADGTLLDISKELERVRKVAGDNAQKGVLKKIGEAVKKKVEQSLAVRRTAIGTYKEYHRHMIDDVKVSVKKNKRTGVNFVSVGGGKETGRLWHLVSDGHVQNGHFTAGNKFIDKAVSLSESDVDTIVNQHIKEAIR